jgi:hypothetical protein
MSTFQAAAIILFCASIPPGAQAQAVAGDMAAAAPFTPDALDQMLRPIALYPDPLLADLFAAAAVPAQIVMADRYVNSGGDLSQIAAQPWDPSVQALAHYASVLQWLDDNLPWTTEVGEAFLDQQQDVMASIQRLRLLAKGQGNLPSSPQENVVSDGESVEIEPANPDVIYVPNYSWNTIYYDPGVYCSFGVGFPIGLWLAYDWDWRNHHLITWGPGHPRPANWWTQPARNRVAPRGVALWHGPSRAAAGAARSPDRGFAVETFRPAQLTAPAAPQDSGREAGLRFRPSQLSAPAAPPPPVVSRPAPMQRENPASAARDSSRGILISAPSPAWQNLSRGMSSSATVSSPAPVVSGSTGGGAFGGSESSSEARQSSSRGLESRSTMPAPSSASSSSSRSFAPSAASSSRPSQPSQSSGSSRGR